MDTSEGSRRRRRRHSAQFKAQVVRACRQPGVSMAAVALAHGLNANLVRRWVVDAERRLPAVSVSRGADEAQRAVPGFVALALPAATPATAEPICIELTRGTTTIRVQWPVSAAGQCAAWLRELL